MKRSTIFLLALVATLCTLAHGQVYPFGGLGAAQFFDNNGNELVNGVLYTYQAGTTTQQATYTDSTGIFPNPDPIPFSTGGRVSIWLTATNEYKFVLCLQNDGPFCAPADVLFSVDQVPACPGCSATGSTTYTGTFISGSSNPATTGILELATTDAICWRNQAGTANLCLTKDTTDVLDWTGSTIKLPEANCSATAANYDYICPNSATHHLSISNNNNVYGGIATVATPGTSGDLPQFAPNGIDLVDSGSSVQSLLQKYVVTGGSTSGSTQVLFTITIPAAILKVNSFITLNLAIGTLGVDSCGSGASYLLTVGGAGNTTPVIPCGFGTSSGGGTPQIQMLVLSLTSVYVYASGVLLTSGSGAMDAFINNSYTVSNLSTNPLVITVQQSGSGSLTGQFAVAIVNP